MLRKLMRIRTDGRVPMRPDEHAAIAGRRLLRDLVPWARAGLRKNPGRFDETSALFAAQRPHITEANFEAR